ncbi:MAG: NADH-quinone oxidoreductase subunit C [Candidatus Micrarchaeaceae archaeon]
MGQLKIERKDLISTLKRLYASGYNYLLKITAVDNVSTLTVLYFLRDVEHNKDELVEVDIDPGDAYVPSVLGLFPSSDWYERELYEMFGIEIKGRHVERLLLEKWNGKGAPLRKNFEWGKPYEKVSD